MTDEKVEVPLVIKNYIKRPPEFEVVEVTRDNIEQVADWLRSHEIHTKRWKGEIQEVIFVGVNDGEDLSVDFPETSSPKQYRTWFLVRDQNYHVEKVSHTRLTNFIEIPQEESIIA